MSMQRLRHGVWQRARVMAGAALVIAGAFLPAARASAETGLNAPASGSEAETLWLRGREAASRGALETATGFYRRSLALAPGCRSPLIDLGGALIELGRLDEARRAFVAVLASAPDEPRALNGIGYVEYREQKNEAAIRDFRLALAKQDLPIYRLNLGLTYLQQGAWGQAEDAFSRAIALSRVPNYWALNDRGYVRALEGQLPAAAEDYAAAIALPGKHVAAHLNLATLMTRQEAWEDAYDVYLDALKRDDGTAEAHLGLAIASLRLQRLDQAYLEGRVAAWLDPKRAASRAVIADALAARGEVAQAIVPLTHAIRLAPTDAGLRFTLARLYEKLDRGPDALAAYREYLRLAPNGAQADQARLALELSGKP